MREFNTSGPCNPALHYTVMREALIAKGKEKVRKGRYFTIFAPRQAGKTTYFQLLLEAVKEEGFTPIWISFEKLKTVTRDRFYQDLNNQLHKRLAEHKIKLEHTIADQIDVVELFEKIRSHAQSSAEVFHYPPKNFRRRSVVLVIDEFEGIPDAVLSEMMHAFRQMYHQKPDHALHSLILVGVSTIAELVMSVASPFNVVEELKISYFTPAELNQLIEQYVAESGQKFEDGVIKAIYDNTKGQPGLVCALIVQMLKKVASGKNKNRSVTMDDFLLTLNEFLMSKYEKNILNIIQKAEEKKAFMCRLLFGEQPINFNIYIKDIAYLYANGVIDNIDDRVGILVPLYSKCIITAFRPVSNGETRHYGLKVNDSFDEYLKEGGLNIHAILKKYRQYVRRRGFKAFDTENLKDAAWHYSLDGFINFFIDVLEGQTFIEVPSGAGRTDILIVYKNRRYLIETKIFSDNTRFKKGKGQLAEYLKSEDLDEGYYVVFSSLHTDENTLYFDEKIKGRRIYTYVICTNFPTPSRLPVPEELKQVTQTELITRRRDLLEVLVLRFDPPFSLYRQIEHDLLNFTDVALLKKLLAAAVQSEDVMAFQSVMDNL